MKILVVHNKYQIRGGEDTVVENEIAMLKEHGHRVFEYIRDNSEIEKMSKIERFLLPISSIFNLSCYHELKTIMRNNSIDLVHVHNTHVLISPSVFYAAKKLKIPIIMTLHNYRLICANALLFRDGCVCEDCIENSRICGIRNACYRGSRIRAAVVSLNSYVHVLSGIYRYVSFICLTEFNKAIIQRSQLVDGSDIYVKSHFASDPIKNYAQEERDVYLYAGRLEEYKGIKTIVEAFMDMPDRELIVAGTGSLFYELKETLHIRKCSNIFLLGEIDRNELAKYYLKAKALVCGSKLYETFGMTVIEAFSYGTPVISADFGNVGALVSDGVNGVKYAVGSKNNLIHTVKEFEKLNWNMLSANAYKTYIEKYSKKRNYDILMQIYNDVLIKKGSISSNMSTIR